MAPGKHLIKKYANRKLYDTETSRYITLDGISELVRDGHDIQVVDRETGRDLTPLILSQIVMGEEKRSRERAGEEMQHDGIQERGQALLDYVRGALNVPAALVSGEMERRRSDVEGIVEIAIDQALKRLSIPTRKDIARLQRRLDDLAVRLEALQPASPRAPSPLRSNRTRTASARRST